MYCFNAKFSVNEKFLYYFGLFLTLYLIFADREKYLIKFAFLHYVVGNHNVESLDFLSKLFVATNYYVELNDMAELNFKCI